MEFELYGMELGALLVGREDAGCRARDREGSGEVGVVSVEDIKASCCRRIVGIGRDPFGACLLYTSDTEDSTAAQGCKTSRTAASRIQQQDDS